MLVLQTEKPKVRAEAADEPRRTHVRRRVRHVLDLLQRLFAAAAAGGVSAGADVSPS